MKMPTTALVIVVLILSGYIVYSQGYLNSLLDPKLVRICEVLTKERLRSPSTYNRTEASLYDENLTLNEALKHNSDLTEIQRNSIEQGRTTPKLFTVFIKYEAANAYGTPVAGITMCEYYSSSGSDKYASEISVKINGKTQTERMIEGLRQ